MEQSPHKQNMTKKKTNSSENIREEVANNYRNP